MRSTSALGVIACLVASVVPVAAQQRGLTLDAGPISRSLAREAARLVASGECAAAQGSSSQAENRARPVELKWSELGPLVAGQHVEVTLTDGRVVRGEALAVRDEALVVDATTTQTGTPLIPRMSVGQITLKRLQGSGGRALGTVLGVLGGLWIGGYAASTTDSAGAGWPVFLGLSTAISVGGYHAGKAADTRTTRITIIP